MESGRGAGARAGGPVHQGGEANIKAGLPPCDAREEAEKDWLMMEPEDAQFCAVLP